MDKQKTIKTFTIEEANSLLPQLSECLDRTAFLFQRLRSLTKDIEDLHYIWGKDIASDNPDYTYYLDKVSERERAVREINAIVTDINNLGCIVKDAESGLVDFYFDNDGEIVFLCWRKGEKAISQWHHVDGGFRTRQSIDTMKL